jgi:hypothetical protein
MYTLIVIAFTYVFPYTFAKVDFGFNQTSYWTNKFYFKKFCQMIYIFDSDLFWQMHLMISKG